jgi:pyrroline-5-carboxylate reductase
MAEIGFIGAGNMAEAIIGGIVKKGLYKPAKISIYDVRPERVGELSSAFGVSAADSLEALARSSKVIILAVKPDKIPHVLGQAKKSLAGKLVISIAAGVPMGNIQSVVGIDARVVRVMPNTPALVLEGASALCASASCSQADVKTAFDIFSAIGRCVKVDEGMMNAVTALSGSGPAFCFLFLEALADGAVRAGLPRDLAVELAAATLRGAATMVLQTGRHPGALKDMVASPGGTTIEGIAVLEAKGFRSAAMEAVYAAFQKAGRLVS